MIRPTKKVKTGINKLPDELLCKIISLLPIDEAVRSSIVCKRWKALWMSASRLDFDYERMKTFFSSLKYAELVRSLLGHHCGNDLISCCFRHTSIIAVVESLVAFVVLKYKRLSTLTLECVSINLYLNFKASIFSNLSSLELTNYILCDSAFDGCQKLKILKMKRVYMDDETLNGILKNCSSLEKFSLVDSTSPMLVMRNRNPASRNLISVKKLNIRNPSLKILELQSLTVQEIDVSVENLQVLELENITCPPKSLKIYALCLKAFYSSCKKNKRGNPEILKAVDIIENCSDLYEYRKINIFRYLSTLSIELDLNLETEANALSFVLKSCLYLKTLEITIPVEKGSNCGGYSSVLWGRSRYNCIKDQLKFATIRGFTGKNKEVAFVKHFISNASIIERISIICDDLKVAEEVAVLLSLPRASLYLSKVRVGVREGINSDFSYTVEIDTSP
ncbi:hypothetical protein RIF29_42003 [Crotalaria pallida]|uniref:F-box domain-containing protein n=1 Tax=Crotalaria pallida TaxID=3830 RepID=A0AAN9HS60_CROPI